MDRQAWREKVAAELASVGIVDAHEHTLGRHQRQEINPDLFDWIQESYYYATLLASGMSEADSSAQGPDDGPRRWQVLRPHLRRTCTSAYAHVIDLATHNLFDFRFDSLDDNNWPELSRRFQEANQRESWFEEVLGRRIGVKVGLLDWYIGATFRGGVRHPGGWYDYLLRVRLADVDDAVLYPTVICQIDTPFFRPVFRIDTLFYGYLRGGRREIRQEFGVDADQVETLDDYLRVVDRCFENIVARGGVGLKSSISAARSLEFPKTDRAAAEKVFAMKPPKLTPREARDFENYVMHVIVQKSIEYHLPFQIHTGTSFAGYSRDDNGRADHLFSLIAAYPEAQFDLFHGGFPYPGESARLAGRFPNVYLNFAWFTWLAPTEARHALSSWIEMVPMHKFLWGGDSAYVEESYGAFLLSRHIVADALYDKIQEGWLDEATALEFARGMFHDNAMSIFDLSEHSASGE